MLEVEAEEEAEGEVEVVAEMVAFVEEEVHVEAEAAHPEVVAVVVALGVEGDFRICNIFTALLLFCYYFWMHRPHNDGQSVSILTFSF